MATSTNPIVQASEATMTSGGLPPSGTVYEFINTDKGNALWYLDSNGNFGALGLTESSDCACRLSNKFMCGINEALETGLMTAAQYEAIIALGFNVTVTNTPTSAGGNTYSIVMGSMSAAVSSVTMTSKITTLAIAATHQSGVTIAPINGFPNVVWISSNPGFATVDQTGLITGVSAGTVTISVYSVFFPTKFDTTTIVVS